MRISVEQMSPREEHDLWDADGTFSSVAHAADDEPMSPREEPTISMSLGEEPAVHLAHVAVDEASTRNMIGGRRRHLRARVNAL